MKRRPPLQVPRFRPRHRGVALVVILAFVALLTALVLAYFSYSSLQRQISSANSNQATVDLFARGAFNSILTDLRQEIAAGSSVTNMTTGAVTNTLYFSSTNIAAVPSITGFATNAGLENLVKVSRYGTNFFPSSYPNAAAYPATSRAANVSSTNSSQNGRAISLARWNKALLMPSTTATNGTFVAPDWILVNRGGGNPTAWNTNMVWSGSAAETNTVIGRYAYAIYDEGGLLDVNVAGYPPGTPTSTAAYKYGGLSYADLTQVGLNTNTISALVGWRNIASAQPSGSFPNYGFDATAQTNFFKAILQNASGFRRAANTNMSTSGESDHLFVSRQELLKFFDTLAANGVDSKTNLQNSARYLGTFSRTLDQPSFISAVQSSASAPVVLATTLGGNSAIGGDKLINPSFPTTRVQTAFTRNDGTTASAGDPLVKKRFALQRLTWITYKGPSSTRSQSDTDIQSLLNNGITWDYLQQGTPENIQKYFGLTWDSGNSRWKYNVHNGGATGSGKIMLVGRPKGTAADGTTYVQDANREPDFFELLKAGITVGSLGKASATSATSATAPSGYALSQVPVNLRYNLDTSVDYHVIQIGANILSEVNPTSYPVRVTFNDGSARGLLEFQGVTDLPYLSYVFNGVLRTRLPSPVHPTGGNQAVDSSPFQYPTAQTVTLTDPGNAYMVQVPAVWNPYDPNGTAGVLRPAKFRVVVESNDPLSPSGSGDLPLCHFASAASSAVAGSGVGAGNQGLGPPGAVYSLNATGVGRSTEQIGGVGTPVYDAVTFNDSNGALYREPTIIFSTVAPGNATRAGALASNSPAGDITSIDVNLLPGETDGSSGPWAPLVLGQFPLAFASGTTAYYTGMGYIALTAGNGDNRVYFTYRLQYQDPSNSNNWITYDTKYGRTTHGLFGFQSAWNQSNPLFSSSVVKGPDWYSAYSWASAIDPRTARFGLITETYNGGRSRATGAAPPDVGWIFNSSGATTTLGITYPIRQDNASGFCLVNLDNSNVPQGAPNGDASQGLLAMGAFSSKDIPYPSFAAGWASPVYPVNEGHGESDVWMFAPGLFAQNNPSSPIYVGSNRNGTVIEPSYYADADGVVRRATGAYVLPASGTSASSPVGLPTASINGYSGKPASLVTPASATPFTQSQSRPLLLHRPFRTVAELGYVFRDLPWKNLDFSTPESGDAALLDLFCINETSDSNAIVAGKVNLNTRQAPVLAAIVSGAYVDDPKVSNATVGALSTSVSGTIAAAVVARTSGTTNYGPLQNLSELVGKWNSAVATSSGFSYTQVVSSAGGGIDLPLASGYIDGKLSYTGFSGIYINGATTATSPPTDLSSAYSAASYSNASLQTSLSQIQRFREAPIRALASAGQTRIWNLMIDIVAQTGRYPQTASALDRFVVEGEQRYWVHLAIDRLTGQIVDRQIEIVKE